MSTLPATSSKLIPRLGSYHDGEVLATVATNLSLWRP
jgi:hypothetical protein